MPSPAGRAQVRAPWPLTSSALHRAANGIQSKKRLGPIGVTDLGTGSHVVSARHGPSTGSFPGPVSGFATHIDLPDKGYMARLLHAAYRAVCPRASSHRLGWAGPHFLGAQSRAGVGLRT